MPTGSAQVPTCCSNSVLGDFNSDGFTDIASPDPFSNTVDLLLAATVEATATVDGISPVGAGTHLVAASYPGDSSYTPSASSTTALTVPVATPVFLPPPGTYNSVQSIAITDATPGATIYYLVTGPSRTSGFLQYTGPIMLSAEGAQTIQAYATATGLNQSLQVTANYNLLLPPTATPVLSLAPGTYSGAQRVAISDSMAGALIYYSLDGVTPTWYSTLYTGPVAISSSETLVATALASGHAMSAPASAQYLIRSSSVPLIYTVAGDGNAGYSGNGGPAATADLNVPTATAMDKAGNVYIADSANSVVRKVAAGTGIITTYAGSGTAGYAGDNKAAISAELWNPAGLAVDSAGNLYIADTVDCVIRKVNAATGVITTYAGTGTYGYNGDNKAATSANLSGPARIAFDRSNNFYVADEGAERIRKVAAATGTITTVAGSGQWGYQGDNGPATSASLATPAGVAVDSHGNLCIADSSNQVIREVNAATQIISTVAGNGNGQGGGWGGYRGDGGPATSAELNRPQDVAVDSAGNFYIADSYNDVIRMVTAATGVITTVAGNAPYGDSASGDGGPATSASLDEPEGIAVDSAGVLYIADTYGNRILSSAAYKPLPSSPTAEPVLDVPAGTYVGPQTVTITDSTPSASIYFTTDGTKPSAASLAYNGPINVPGSVTIKAIAVAPSYVQSAPVKANYTIASPATSVITTVAGIGIAGFSGANGPATGAAIGGARSLALDSTGNIYFTDSEDAVVWKVTAKTGIISIVAGNGYRGYQGNGGPTTEAQLGSPTGIAIDAGNDLYISDPEYNVARKVTASTGTISTYAGNGETGSYSFSNAIGDGGKATSAELNYPTGLALDSAGNLYIVDTYHEAIRKVTAATGVITTVAGGGTAGYFATGVPATKITLSEPAALAFGPAGNLYIADFGWAIVHKVATSTGIITIVAGNFHAGYSGDRGSATRAEIYAEGLATDSAGNLYIANSPGAIREVAAKTGIITTVAGNRFFGYAGDGGPATLGEICFPNGIAIDSSGNLYIADTNNYRVREVGQPTPTPTPKFSLSAGTDNGAKSVTITDTLSSASIYYALDGTTPTTSAN